MGARRHQSLIKALAKASAKSNWLVALSWLGGLGFESHVDESESVRGLDKCRLGYE